MQFCIENKCCPTEAFIMNISFVGRRKIFCSHVYLREALLFQWWRRRTCKLNVVNVDSERWVLAQVAAWGICTMGCGLFKSQMSKRKIYFFFLRTGIGSKRYKFVFVPKHNRKISSTVFGSRLKFSAYVAYVGKEARIHALPHEKTFLCLWQASFAPRNIVVLIVTCF